MRAYERLLDYVKIHTTSDENTGTTPSAVREFDLAEMLVEEMKLLGIENCAVDDKCYVYGRIPATPGYEDKTKIGFIAHLDTSPSCSGENVKACIWENYDGGDIMLPSGRLLSPSMFPELKNQVGRTLITSDGSTLLGADDKAGIAEILTMAERIFCSGMPHGEIEISFTPDEEIGAGAEDLDLERFGAEFAYTVDGGAENELEFENFNASMAIFEIVGKSVHPGEAKNKMVNAALVAAEISRFLPPAQIPSMTEGREGFFHLTSINGNVEHARTTFLVRDHDADTFDARLDTLKHIEKLINETYGEGTAKMTVIPQYRNMIEKIRPCMHLIETARAAMKDVGMESAEIPVRGGTDGAQLSFRGLPCPNIGTGGHAYHGPYEFISVEGMDLTVEVLLGIVRRYAS